jgi:hypothetical protein
MSDLSPLSRRLLRRASESIGVVDVHRPRQRHDRAKALLRRHVAPVAHMVRRAGDDATPPAATGFVFVAPAAAPHVEPPGGQPASTDGLRAGDAVVQPAGRIATRTSRSSDGDEPRPTTTRPAGSVESAAPVTGNDRANPITIARSPLPLIRSSAPRAATGASAETATMSRAKVSAMVSDTSDTNQPIKTMRSDMSDGGVLVGATQRRTSPQLEMPVGRRVQSDGTSIERDRSKAMATAKPIRDPLAQNGSMPEAADQRQVLRVARSTATPAPSVAAATAPTALTLMRPTVSAVHGVARAGADTAVAADPTATPSPFSAGPAPLASPVARIQRVPASVASAGPSAPPGPLPLHSVNTSRIATAIARTATNAGAASQTTSALTIARATEEPRTVTATAAAPSPATDRQEGPGGGASFSPDRMMSQMLRRMAIERERRGGGRWP